MIKSVDLSVYNDTNEYLSKLSDIKLLEELKFRKIYSKTSQGVVGLVTHTDKRFIFKLSKHVDFLIRHEDLTMKRLNEMKDFCPHFVGSYGIRRLPVNSDFSESTDSPFHISKEDKHIFQDVLFIEYIKNSITLTSQIDNLDPRRVYAIIRQVLLALEMGQQYCKFVHFDLHTDNILLSECEKNSVFLYRFQDKSIAVPTYGVYPILIDFGFAHTDAMNGKPIYGPMNSTDAGYLTALYDPVCDPKVFLTSNTKDLKDESDTYGYIRRWVKGLFSGLDIDWYTGWDNNDEFGAAEYITENIMEFERKHNISRVFRRNTMDCVCLLQTLTNFPFVDNGDGSIGKYYKPFIQEFNKIESEIKTDHFRCYALAQLVDAVRDSRKEASAEAREKAVRLQFVTEMMKVIAFYSPPSDVNYEVLINSMDNIGDTISTVYARVMKGKKKEKQEQYKKLHTRSIRDMYNFIEMNFSTPFKFDRYTVVYVWDIVDKTYQVHRGFTEKQLRELNDSKMIHLGETIETVLSGGVDKK